MSRIDDFKLDIEDDMDMKHAKPNAKDRNGSEFNCIAGILPDLIKDFENKLDAYLDIEKDVTKDPFDPDVMI